MEFTAESIAALIGGVVEGDPKAAVSTFSKIEEGKAGSLTFLANPKYTHFIYTTGASIVLVANDFKPEQPVSATLIRVPDPYQSIAQLLQMVQQAAQRHPVGLEQPCSVAEGVEVPADAYVGAFAYVGRGAKLGKGCKIYPQAYVGADVEIGEDTIIYPGVKIYHGCKIGARCIIHAGAVIGADGFGFAPDDKGEYHKIPQMGIVRIDDDVEIGANTTIDRAMMGETHIHRGVKLDNLIQIAHNVQVGSHTVMAAQVGIAGSTKVGEHCMLGGQVGTAGHIAIGDGVQIGAQSGIANNVAAGERIMGTPATKFNAYARQLSRLRHLDELFDRVRDLEKKSE